MLYLYPSDQTEFNRNGLPIVNAYDAHVVRDEGFLLKFNVAIDEAKRYRMLAPEMIVGADTPDGENQFRIVTVLPKDYSVYVEALHLFYDFDKRLVTRFRGSDLPLTLALKTFKDHLTQSLDPFTLTTDLQDKGTLQEKKESVLRNALDVLIGKENSFKSVWDCEFLLNGFDVRIVKRLGTKTNALIYEKKNVSSFEEERTIRPLVTRARVISRFQPTKDDPNFLTPSQEIDAKYDERKKELQAAIDAQLKAKRSHSIQAAAIPDKKSATYQEQRRLENLARTAEKSFREQMKQLTDQITAEKKKKAAEIKKQKDEGKIPDGEVVLDVTVDSPILSNYARIHEAIFEVNDLKTEKELREYGEKLFSEKHLDKPQRSIKVQTNIIDGTVISYGDELILRYTTHYIDEPIRCCGYDYDPIGKTYYSVTLGSQGTSFGQSVSSSASAVVNGILDSSAFERYLQQRTTHLIAANGIGRLTFGPDEPKNSMDGDKWFRFDWDRPHEVTVYMYQDGFWTLLLDLYTSERIEEVIDDFEAQVDEMTDRMDDVADRNEKDLQRIRQQMDAFKTSGFDEMRAEVQRVSDTVSANAKMVGTDGKPKYNKNRTTTTNGMVALDQDYMEVAHNGEGFEVGKTYTISFEEVCMEAPHSAVTILLTEDNLIRDPNPQVTNQDYRIVELPIVGSPTTGDKYRIRLKGTMYKDRHYFGIYNSGGNIQLTALNASHLVHGVYDRTFIWRAKAVNSAGKFVETSNDRLSIYMLYSYDPVGMSTVDWAILEKVGDQ